ncbi:23S rRNA (pseudouridine(1915)-N(3))-methyltransferase RlmH [Candidatus Peregrinibacteria bacterium]|nr:23S rRNA (pseudouridine(1915)-N(3))-methyltransferase RlmH [Candidatus Peregrinibacteria bacterium]
MKVKVLVVGKTKESWCRDGEKFYFDRVQHFCDLQKVEVAEEKITESMTDKEIVQREGLRLLSRIGSDEFVVVLTPSGKKLSSKDFADLFREVRDYKGGKITFLIGGPLGLSNEVIGSAQAKISFSDMTFPHDLFRIMLLEQIYRAFSILVGKKYHK